MGPVGVDLGEENTNPMDIMKLSAAVGTWGAISQPPVSGEPGLT